MKGGKKNNIKTNIYTSVLSTKNSTELGSIEAAAKVIAQEHQKMVDSINLRTNHSRDPKKYPDNPPPYYMNPDIIDKQKQVLASHGITLARFDEKHLKILLNEVLRVIKLNEIKDLNYDLQVAKMGVFEELFNVTLPAAWERMTNANGRTYDQIVKEKAIEYLDAKMQQNPESKKTDMPTKAQDGKPMLQPERERAQHHALTTRDESRASRFVGSASDIVIQNSSGNNTKGSEDKQNNRLANAHKEVKDAKIGEALKGVTQAGGQDTPAAHQGHKQNVVSHGQVR